MSFTVQSAAGIYLDYRGSGRLYLGTDRYCVLGVNGKQNWIQMASGIENGVLVTLKCTPDKVTIWLNGERVTEDAVLDTKGAGVPKVSWTNAETTLTDIRIWIKSAVSLNGCMAILDGSIGMNFFMNLNLSDTERGGGGG